MRVTDEHREMRAVTRRLLGGASSGGSTARSEATGEVEDADELWRRLADHGLQAALAPADIGGLGLALADVHGVLEEVGWACPSEPLAETIGVVVPALARQTSDPRCTAWLQGIAEGRLRATVANSDTNQAIVPGGRAADLVLLIRPHELRVVLRENLATREQSSLDFSLDYCLGSYDVAETSLLSREPDDIEFARAAHLAVTAAVLNGVGTRLVHDTVTYMQQRTQFGQLIGSFSPVKHHLANAHRSLVLSRASTERAMHALTVDAPDAALAARVAISYASSAHSVVNKAALQCHGAIGFSWEYPLHRWLKRGLALSMVTGSPRSHRRWLQARLFADGTEAL
jgi:alkylation response protein AidB-like acyl-CoA dehydrogenase